MSIGAKVISSISKKIDVECSDKLMLMHCTWIIMMYLLRLYELYFDANTSKCAVSSWQGQ